MRRANATIARFDPRRRATCAAHVLSQVERPRCIMTVAAWQRARCLIPRFDGAILSQEWKEALWDKLVTGAPRPRSPSELQYSDRKLRSRS